MPSRSCLLRLEGVLPVRVNRELHRGICCWHARVNASYVLRRTLLGPAASGDLPPFFCRRLRLDIAPDLATQSADSPLFWADFNAQYTSVFANRRHDVRSVCGLRDCKVGTKETTKQNAAVLLPIARQLCARVTPEPRHPLVFYPVICRTGCLWLRRWPRDLRSYRRRLAMGRIARAVHRGGAQSLQFSTQGAGREEAPQSHSRSISVQIP
jgi:hypothetical protein